LHHFPARPRAGAVWMQGVAAMAHYQVRGCCCGVPFGCGTVILVALGYCLWKLAGVPGLVALLHP
jgi:hypothetical protein